MNPNIINENIANIQQFDASTSNLYVVELTNGEKYKTTDRLKQNGKTADWNSANFIKISDGQYAIIARNYELVYDRKIEKQTNQMGANLSREEQSTLLNGGKTAIQNLQLPNNETTKQQLDNQNIKYTENGDKILIDGKLSTRQILDFENNSENRNELKKNQIEFAEEGSRLSVSASKEALRKLATTTLILTNPLAGLVLVLHPRRKEVVNKHGLSNREIEKLKNGAVLSINENGKKVYYQIDSATNELLKGKNAVIPQKINNIKLSKEQRENLASGKEVKIGENLFQIDLKEKNGITSKNQFSHKNIAQVKL